jgi:hypothetical protein
VLLILWMPACSIAVKTYPVRPEVWPGSSGKHPYPERSHAQPPAAVEVRQPALSRRLKKVIKTAQRLQGQAAVEVAGRRFASDCSGFVRGCFWSLGVDLFDGGQGESGTAILYDRMKRDGRVFRRGPPAPGDLVFFDNTWDRNGNGRLDDRLTHVGIVEEVGPRGTVTFLHHVGGTTRAGRLNLQSPSLHADPATGVVLNDHLRRRTDSDPRGTKYLTGSLFAGFGRPSTRALQP